MKPNLRLLSAFLAVAEHASFRKAADQLHLSLPAISMQIKQLEEGLGLVLFQRTTRRVELTADGEQLLISARRAMEELDEAFTRLQQVADLHRGRLAFACVPTIAGTRLPFPLTQFAQSYRGISIHVRELIQPDLLDAIRRHEVEFGIGPSLEDSNGFEFRPVFEDPYVALLPERHAVEERSEIALSELAEMPILSLASSQFHEHVLQALDAQGLTVELNYNFTNVSTLIAMVDAGLGAAVLPLSAAPQRDELKVLRLIHPSMCRTISIITLRGHVLSPAATRFVKLFENSLSHPAGLSSTASWSA
jgi:DNA-binding transcriptional LysR family regulator